MKKFKIFRPSTKTFSNISEYPRFSVKGKSIAYSSLERLLKSDLFVRSHADCEIIITEVIEQEVERISMDSIVQRQKEDAKRAVELKELGELKRLRAKYPNY